MRKISSQSDPIFKARHLGTLISNQGKLLEQRVEDYSADEILTTPIEDMVDQVFAVAYLEPLKVLRNQIQASTPVEINHFSSEQQAYTSRGFG